MGRLPSRILLASLLAAGLVVRLLHGAAALGYDECQHFLVARSPFFADFWREFRQRAHPPLSYLPIKLSLAFGTSPLVARSSALVFGMLAAALAYPTLRAAKASRAAALAGSGAAIFLPAFVQQSVEVRHYALCLVFIWASFWICFGEWRSPLRQSVALGAVQLLALLCEYSAAFHVLALTAVSVTSQSGWRQRAYRAGPQLLALALAALLFRWQFDGTFPLFPHTEPFVYTAGPAAFFTNGTARFFAGILPAPWAWAIPALALLAYRRAPRFSLYCLVALLLVFTAAMARTFPFGGVPRHTVVLLPGILIACVLGGAHLIELLPRARPMAAALLLAALAPGFVAGLRDLRAARPIYDLEGWRALQELHTREPGPWVANWRGRALLSWWFLAERVPRQRDGAFDYDGVTVVESDGEIAEAATKLVQQQGRCWMLLAYFRGDPIASTVEQLLRKDPALSIDLERWDRLQIPMLLLRLKRSGQ